jgi:hypothetical protein
VRLALALALLGALVMAPSAEAYKRLNYRWPSKTITYYDATGKAYSKNVAAAADAWNKSGQKARWKKTSKSKARVQIRVNKNIPSAGLATYFGGQRGLIQIQPGMKKTGGSKAYGEWVATTIMTHEMGHIMGLDHETKKCAVMQPSIGIGCPNAKNPWQFRCRVLEPDDVRGGVALFGGKIGKVGPEFCDQTPPPPAPTDVRVEFVNDFVDPEGYDDKPISGVRVHWTTPASKAVQGVRIMRRQGTCPTGIDDKQAELVGVPETGTGPQELLDDTGFPGNGTYCYAVLTVGEFNRPSAPATAFYEHTAGASAAYRPTASFYYDYADDLTVVFEDYSEGAKGGEITAWNWDFGDGASSTERNPTHTFAPRVEPYTVTLTVTDSSGQTASLTREVVVEGPPIDHGDVER